jgi:hypothetical protein
MSDEDLKLAEALLIGRLEWDRKGRARTKYLKGAEEEKARQAIARLLVNDGDGLGSQLRGHLAHLFAPGPRGQRRLKFVFLKEGKPEDRIAGAHLFMLVLDEVRAGKRPTKAIESVAEQFSLSVETVTRAWSKYRQEYLPGLNSKRRS